MKTRLFAVLLNAILAVSAMTGCQAVRIVESAVRTMALYAEYEIEHGVPQYDVEFRRGYWEYDYEIQKRNRPHSCVSTFLRRILERELS
ncbi:MAG: PepSY domain-containing protein [Oscillospiraceae bacterium]|nr:PepSY domain-containing protein [Oscillospiraceae bacterium]